MALLLRTVMPTNIDHVLRPDRPYLTLEEAMANLRQRGLPQDLAFKLEYHQGPDIEGLDLEAEPIGGNGNGNGNGGDHAS